jgi:hypothetical protein
MNPTRWIRLALAYLALQGVQIGLWALFAPRSFYDGFPGLGRGWISVDGPYNEHLIRDVGALNLGLAVVFIWAAATVDRTLVRCASVAALVWGVPHFPYHLFNTEGLSAGDQVGVLGGLGLFAALPVFILVTLARLPAEADVS